MTVFWIILFFTGAAGLLHTYLFYPLILWALSRRKPREKLHFQQGDPWPRVSVLMSVFNEEPVIAKKLDSLFQTDYPAELLRFFFGSDASGDRTNELIREITKGRSDTLFTAFQERRGKPGVINDLARQALEKSPPAAGHLLLITDANVFLQKSTIRLLARHFKDPRIGLVDAHMVNTGFTEEGISRSESQYIRVESLIKSWEGQVWGTMIGPFGGCYLLRSDLFTPIPPHYLVDDFFLAMRAFEKNAMALNDLEALCFEAVSHEIKEEFRRKARIAAGNFQNMLTFWRLWVPPFSRVGFSFFSHKILRWFGPFFLIFMLASSFALGLEGNNLFAGLFFFQLVFWFLIPVADWFLEKRGINGLWLRSIRYFLVMNLALLAGFFRFLRGIRSGVWQPPKRV